jgi:hypothetical protein
MGTTIIENDESAVETNVVKTQEQVETPKETTGEEQPEAIETPSEKPEEATIEIDGQQVALSQAKEALDVLKNQKSWNAKNTQKAQEIAAKERELQEALLISQKVQRRPDLIKQLFAPEPERNIDAELKAHHDRRTQLPIDPGTGYVDANAYYQWEQQRDELLVEKAELRATKKSEERLLKQSANEYHDQLVKTSAAAFEKEGFTTEEFMRAQQWVVDNIKTVNERYPSQSLEWAKRELFGDRAISQVKLEASRKAAEAIEKAKPANPAGAKPKVQETDLTDEDRAFLEEMAARTR